MDGFLLIDKDGKMTSFDVIRILKRKLHTPSIGHAGTLDPFATGLLIVGVNKATKLLSFVESEVKEYIGVLRFGIDTDTLDLEGKVISEKDYSNLSITEIKETMKTFLGKISQIPPMYSALKVDGKRLYELARNGIEIERKAREVMIEEFTYLDYQNGLLTFKVRCSKGTYVRTLANDLAHKLGTCGHLISLRRTRIGNFNVLDAKKVNDISEEDIVNVVTGLTLPKVVISDEKLLKMVKNGMSVKLECNEEEVMLLDNERNLIAIYYRNGLYYKSKRGY
ncbi:MAG: tRNA pseudouridine(55) synthase TruB [Bacilli bacterium]|nr:tRNA pseudouridine(55) synthase TruB [Bacilli bacterium]